MSAFTYSALDQQGGLMNQSKSHLKSLTPQQQAIIIISTFAAAGDMSGLNAALNQGLGAGVKISDAREVLIQLYAYAGFPRSLNAITELMKVLEARNQRGIHDEPGLEPSQPIPKGDDLLVAGTANQTTLAGSVVQGPLFDFAPVANEYLRTHLFGDIFERDNLDWKTRELATIGMLSALSGVEPQLQAHMRMSMNTGLTERHLLELCQLLGERAGIERADRAKQALQRHLASIR
nr:MULTISPECIES: carboxymuconolactone decarboxylase family protein [Pseudomonas]